MIVNSDALSFLQIMDDESVHCATTSPAYYGLRKYGTNPDYCKLGEQRIQDGK